VKEIDKRILTIVKSCDDKKGFDIKVLDLRKLTPITDYFIIVSGNSTIQVISIADEIEEKMEEANTVTMAVLPRIQPTSALQNPRIFWLIPPTLIKFPAYKKKGIANKGNESITANVLCDNTVVGRLP